MFIHFKKKVLKLLKMWHNSLKTAIFYQPTCNNLHYSFHKFEMSCIHTDLATSLILPRRLSCTGSFRGIHQVSDIYG